MNEHERLFVLYQKAGPFLYAYVHIVRGSLENQESSFPFIVSKHVNDQEVVYGTVANLMLKVAGLIFDFEKWHQDLKGSLSSEVKTAIRTVNEGTKTVFELPQSEQTELFFQRLEQKIEETVILTSLHMRTMLEIFSGNRNVPIGLYDYEDNRIGDVPLMELANLLMHHRYLVVKDYCVHNIFSDKKQLLSTRLLGSKIRVHELFDTIKNVLNDIKVRDFTGVVRSRLERLSVNSEARDIVFLIQNIRSITYIVQERFEDSSFSEVTELLLRDINRRHITSLPTAGNLGPVSYSYSLLLGRPEFQIDDDLSARKIVMHIKVNGENEELKFGYEEFFDALTSACGDEALLSPEQLRTGLYKYPTSFRKQNALGIGLQ